MKTIFSTLILSLLLTVSYAQDANIEDQIIKKHLKDNNIKAESTEGIYYTITKPSKLAKVKEGDTISVHYELKRLSKDGKIVDKVIDSSYGSNPFSLVVGAGSVIQGWEIGLLQFHKGEEGTLYIPSRLAYGSREQSKDLPANAILVFDIQVLESNEKLGGISFKTMQIVLFLVVIVVFVLYVKYDKKNRTKKDSEEAKPKS